MADERPQQAVRTVCWEEEGQNVVVCLIDQSLLPQQVSYLKLRHEREVADAITTMKVRGAPAIGVTAAFGVALAFHRLWQTQGEALTFPAICTYLDSVSELFRRTRPTAVNLFWSLERMQACARRTIGEHSSLQYVAQRLRDEAQAIAREDFDACMKMGLYGADLISDGDSLLTHCNTGVLATTGWGTALAPMYVAHNAGKKIHVFVDETRPVLQGARLTAWELQRAGIPLTLITDSMAAYFMSRGEIKSVFVGADRIAANGDVANKIGTYGVAVLAHVHRIPFYVVAPRSTIDLKLSSGEQVPIEQRDPEEVTNVRGVAIAPPGVHVANPAFDVTPHIYVTAIITEMGIARPPYDVALRHLWSDYHSSGK